MWAVTVKAAHEQLGFLVIGGVEDLDDPDRRTIERAGMVTALLLLFERAATDAEQRMRTDLVSDLVGGRGDAAVRQARARGQGLDLGEPHVVLVARGHAEASRRALVMSAHAAVGETALVGEHDGDVVVLVPAADAQECAAVVAARMSRSAEVTVGAAGPVTSVEDIPAAHADARRTTAALLALGRSGTGGSAQSLGFAGLVSGSAPRRGLRGPRARSGPGLRPDARHRPARHPGGVLRRRRQSPPRRDPAARPRQHGGAAAGADRARCWGPAGRAPSSPWSSSWPCGCAA